MNNQEILFVTKTNKAIELCQFATTFLVKTEDDYKIAGLACTNIRTLEKELMEEYDGHPTVIEFRRIQAAKGEIAKSLEAARKTAKDNMMNWEDEQKQARQELQAEAGVILVDETPKIKGHMVMNPWTYLVLGRDGQWHPRTESMQKKFQPHDDIPIEYRVLDHTKIGSVIRSMGDTISIPGIMAKQERA